MWWTRAEDAERIQAGMAGLCRELCRRHGGHAATAAGQAPAEEAAEWALAWLSGTTARWLVVFDNVEDIDDAHRVAGRLGAGHVLLTTRRDVGWEELAPTVIRLDALPHTAAITLLLHLMGPGAAGETEAVGELAHELGGLPLALKQAGAYIALTPGMTVAAYLTLLRTAPLRALSADSRRRASVQAGEDVVAASGPSRATASAGSTPWP
ncbi:hypothetical protein [Microbispora sp. H10836]|uniref:hypothetical protein n=1 Tax=Microbispora sp. H10836 TaxID=2729106 RepID=UPI0014764D7F|nr:hypothetical protein [Microbispora sp. H10836]